MRLRINREFIKCSMVMGTGDRAGQGIGRWIDPEGQDKNVKLELEILRVVEPLKTCPLYTHPKSF